MQIRESIWGGLPRSHKKKRRDGPSTAFCCSTVFRIGCLTIVDQSSIFRQSTFANKFDMPRPANPEIRNRLLTDGGRVVHRLGFNGAGVQDIVAAADVPKGSFYSYFDSKEAFAAEVLEAYWDSIEQRHAKVMYDARIKPVTRIQRLFDLLVEDHAAQGFKLGCLVGNLSLELSNTSGDVRNALESILKRWEGLITACLDEAKMRHELAADCDSAQLAAVIIEAWEGAVLRSKVEGNGTACRRFQQVTLKQLLS